MSEIDVRVPELGDFDSVDVIEVLVSIGDQVEAEQPLLTVETDKAAMDIPAPQPGKVTAVMIAVGEKVSAGDVIVRLEVGQAATAAATTPEASQKSTQAELNRASVKTHVETPVAPQNGGAGGAAAQSSVAVIEQVSPREQFGQRLVVLGPPTAAS